jgi:protein-tyrosine-phosphatase
MKYVLFVCTHNAGRSQMAQALCSSATAPRTFAPNPLAHTQSHISGLT